MMKRLSGPLSVCLLIGYTFSSLNEKNIFRPGWFLEHLGEPKLIQFASYNQPLNTKTQWHSKEE